MNERLREQIGLLSALAVSLVMLVCCRDGACPAEYLSHPALAPLEAPVPSLERLDWIVRLLAPSRAPACGL